MRSRSERGGAAAAFLVAAVVCAVASGCSNDSPAKRTVTTGSSTSASSTVAGSKSSAHTGASSSVGSEQTQGPSAAAPTRSGDPALIFGNEPFYATVRESNAGTVDLADLRPQVKGDGVLVKGADRGGVKVANVNGGTAAVWMSDSFVIEKKSVSACANTCAALKAPRGATQVLLIDPAKVTSLGVDTPISR